MRTQFWETKKILKRFRENNCQKLWFCIEPALLINILGGSPGDGTNLHMADNTTTLAHGANNL